MPAERDLAFLFHMELESGPIVGKGALFLPPGGPGITNVGLTRPRLDPLGRGFGIGLLLSFPDVGGKEQSDRIKGEAGAIG